MTALHCSSCIEPTESRAMLWWDDVNHNIMDFSAKLYKNRSSIVLKTIPAGYAIGLVPAHTVQFRDRYF